MILSLYRNPYTEEGLIRFFLFLLIDVKSVELIELVVNTISVFHQVLIKHFSSERSRLIRGYPRLNDKVYTSDELYTHIGSYNALNWTSHMSTHTFHHF